MMSRRAKLSAVALAAALAACEPAGPEPADLVLTGGDVYTVNPGQPWAEAVAVRGNKIAAVFTDAEAAEPYIGQDTRVIELDGRMLLPGFIDGHVHFERAGALLRDINLLQIASRDGLREEVARVADILAPGEWITGGHWGAYEEWGEGSAGADNSGEADARWTPDRGMVDDLTPDNPIFVQSFESEPELYLANTAALEAAGLLEEPVDGMEMDGDGSPTGLIYKGSPAIERLQAAVKPKSRERRMAENRAALAELRKSGVVEVHDVTDDAQMRRFLALEEAGDLTARVWMRADLSRAAEFARESVEMNTHPETGKRNRYLRWGAYKGYVDGIMGNHSALFFEPYEDQPENSGRYRRHTSDDPPPFETGNMDKIYGYLETAAEDGFVANVHAIGTKGVALLLDTFERLREEAGVNLRGYRMIHAQVVRDQDFNRFGELGLIAEINPFHLSDDMRWMEERIGDRAENAYAFKSLLDSGARLVFGSDWPGTNAAYYHVHPKYLIHAAVNRTTVEHTPEGGWYPDEKISLEQAIRAYTLEGARATFDGAEKGSIEAGKLADLVILDRNLFEIAKKDILDVEVDLTMVDGEIVYERTER